MTYIPTVTIVGHCFHKRRTLALGLATSGVGVGGAVFPVIVRLLVEAYGWRGGILILTGIWMHSIPCCMLYRPDVWSNTFRRAKSNASSNWNLSIFKNSAFLIMCANNVLFCFGMSIAWVHVAAYAQTIGFTRSQAAMLFTYSGIGAFVGRVFLGLLGQIPSLSSFSVYTLVFFSSGVNMALWPLAESYIAMIVFSALSGFLAAGLGSHLPQLLTEILGTEKVTSSFGFMMIFDGAGLLCGAPVAGMLCKML